MGIREDIHRKQTFFSGHLQCNDADIIPPPMDAFPNENRITTANGLKNEQSCHQSSWSSGLCWENDSWPRLPNFQTFNVHNFNSHAHTLTFTLSVLEPVLRKWCSCAWVLPANHPLHRLKKVKTYSQMGKREDACDMIEKYRHYNGFSSSSFKIGNA